MKILVAVVLLTLLSYSTQQEDVVFEQQFIDIEQPAPQPVIPQAQPLPSVSSPRQPFQIDINTLKRYRYQALGISFIFIYLFLYMRGKNENLAIMSRFYQRVQPYFDANFAHIGFSKQSGQVPFNGESPSESLYYATGRDNVDGLEMRFNMKKRHDLIYSIYDILFPQKDTVTFDIPVKSEVPLVLALANKKKIKQMAQKHLDIKKIAGKFKIANLNDYYEVLGQSSDTLDAVLDNYVTKRLNDAQGLFISIHYTDLKIYSGESGHLRVELNPSYKNPEQFITAVQVIFYIADKIAGLRLSANSKARAQKARQAYHQLKERQQLQKHNEQLRKKKEEKMRQQQAWIRSLPPEKQKKEQQKRKKKQLNKMMKGKVLKM